MGVFRGWPPPCSKCEQRHHEDFDCEACRICGEAEHEPWCEQSPNHEEWLAAVRKAHAR